MNPRDLLLYNTADEQVKVSVHFQDGTFWLNQKAMSELYNVERSVVTKHLKNIFETDELSESSVCAKFAHTASDGKNYQTKFYRLEAILAVGYRVNSQQANQEFFRSCTKQTPLGYNRENCGGAYIFGGRCYKIIYGIENMESSSRW